MFTARYGLIPYIKQIMFSLSKVLKYEKRFYTELDDGHFRPKHAAYFKRDSFLYGKNKVVLDCVLINKKNWKVYGRKRPWCKGRTTPRNLLQGLEKDTKKLSGVHGAIRTQHIPKISLEICSCI